MILSEKVWVILEKSVWYQGGLKIDVSCLLWLSQGNLIRFSLSMLLVFECYLILTGVVSSNFQYKWSVNDCNNHVVCFGFEDFKIQITDEAESEIFVLVMILWLWERWAELQNIAVEAVKLSTCFWPNTSLSFIKYHTNNSRVLATNLFLNFRLN